LNTEDGKRFQDLLDTAYGIYGKEIDTQTQRVWWMIFKDFDFTEIEVAVTRHITTSKFTPKPADILDQINGVKPTADQIVALAKVPNTPLGCIARIQIGSWDLDNQDAFYLRQRAEEVLMNWESIATASRSGNYDDHTIAVMKKFNVDPCAPLAPGLPAPEKSRLPALSERSKSIKALPAPSMHFLKDADVVVLDEVKKLASDLKSA